MHSVASPADRLVAQKRKILIVDDESTMQTILTRSLERLGYTHIIAARDGQEALDKLRSTPFDLVISDWDMPKLTGIELLKIIRTNDAYKNVPVLMVTGEASKDKVIEAAKAGASSYIVKPFSLESLQENIEKSLKRRKG
ncbi:MAG: response regulator [Nitrospira sp.]|nr:response regulator [Nitrospira sp.]